MKPEREAGILDKWLENSRALDPKCGCECRGGNWYCCSYHEGAIDAWDDAFRAGAEAQRERDCKALCHWCREGNPVVEANEVITANGHPFWHKVDALSIECHAAKLRSAPIEGE